VEFRIVWCGVVVYMMVECKNSNDSSNSSSLSATLESRVVEASIESQNAKWKSTVRIPTYLPTSIVQLFLALTAQLKSSQRLCLGLATFFRPLNLSYVASGTFSLTQPY
jgi:hypothetical protein